jgi:hypothetical protein
MIDIRDEIEDIRINLENSSDNFPDMNEYEKTIISMLIISVNADIPGLIDRLYSGERIEAEEVVKYRDIFLDSIKGSQWSDDVRGEIHSISFGVDEIYRKLLEMV